MAINSLSASSHGLSGLVSGMGSQDMVEKMLSGTQSKIDRAMQKKTSLQYKQGMYRDVGNKLKTLQSGFLSFTSKTNLLSNAFYNNMTTSIKTAAGVSAAFSVTASSNAKTGNTTIDEISQLAQAYSKKTQWAASGEVKGTLNKAAANNLLSSYTGEDAVLVVEVDGRTLEIPGAGQMFEGMTPAEVAAKMNFLFTEDVDPTKHIMAEARVVNNKLVITADNKDAFIRLHGNESIMAQDKTLGMRMFGTGLSVLSGQGTLSSGVDTNRYRPSFEVELDGRKQNIYMSLADLIKFAGPADSPTDLVDSIQAQLAQEFGTGVKATLTGREISFTSGAESQTFVLKGNSVVMGSMGLKSGISNKLNTAMKLKDLNFAGSLQGDRHSFTINGVGFSYTAETTLSTVINDINNSTAGVNISFNNAEDRFTISRSETGGLVDTSVPGWENLEKKFIDFGQTEGNLLSMLFGENGGNIVSTTPISKPYEGGIVSGEDYYMGGVFTFNVNGANYKFSVAPKWDKSPYSTAQFADKMNQGFRSTFGTLPDGTQVNEFKLNAAGTGFEIVSNDGAIIKATKFDKDNNTSLLGFSLSDSTIVTDGATTLTNLGIEFALDGTIAIADTTGSGLTIASLTAADINGKSLDQIAAKIQSNISTAIGLNPDYTQPKVTYDSVSGGFRIEGVTKLGVELPLSITVNGGTGPAVKGVDRLLGAKEITLAALGGKTDADFVIKHGQNAQLKINGLDIERSSNTFEYDGLTFTLHRETAALEGATLVTTSRDTEVIVDGIKEFLQMYNETVDYMNDLLKADATYKNYKPLSEKEKAGMSDREVLLWEEKSMEGLLRNDPTVGGILQAMRKAMYTKPEGSSISLYDIGIDTSFYSNDGNFKEVSDGDLKAFIEKDPEAVRQLFAGTGGIMELLNTALQDAVKTGYSSPGSLVRVAGSSSLDTSSSIYNQIKEIDNQLTTLEKRYWSEYDRYWKQFNSMETLIQQMNTQSSWLSQQMSG